MRPRRQLTGPDPAPSSPHRPDADEPIEVTADVIRSDGRPMYQLEHAPPQALVIHCGDPRFQTAFRRFITEELGIKHYALVVLGGGVHAFGAQTFMPKNFKILWEQVKFFVKEQGVKRVIIINHEDCGWYHKLRGFHPTVDLPLKGRLDLRQAAVTLLKDFAGIEVESYWAAIENDHIFFSPVSHQ